jgi:hypothetical protein
LEEAWVSILYIERLLANGRVGRHLSKDHPEHPAEVGSAAVNVSLRSYGTNAVSKLLPTSGRSGLQRLTK